MLRHQKPGQVIAHANPGMADIYFGGVSLGIGHQFGGYENTVFGQIKDVIGFQLSILRGLNTVKGACTMLCTAHNLLKIHKAKGQAACATPKPSWQHRMAITLRQTAIESPSQV
jgi:hypothetical protein